jgi:translation initiation factor 2 beta subunit (eIF-2beta)/eIF-5
MPKIPVPNNNHTISDLSYRYQRDLLIISKSGQHYLIDNLDIICKQLKIKKSDIINFMPKYLKQPIKMFGDKVGIKVKSSDILEKMLENYIINNIICSKCSYPEIETNNDSECYMICNSCGQNNKIIPDFITKSKLTKSKSSKSKLIDKKNKTIISSLKIEESDSLSE